MIVIVDGLGTSGKTVLRGLLDGHPEFFVCPNHDMIIDALCNTEDSTWLEYKDILYLRSLLSDTYYYQLEHYSHKKSMDYDMSVKDRCEFLVDFDFYKFDKTWMEKLVKEDKWTPQIIAEHIYISMLEAWNNYPFSKENIKNYVGMGFDRPNTGEQFVKNFPDGKMLYIIRSIEGIIAVRSNRQPVEDDMRSLCLLETTAKRLVKSDHVRKLSSKQRKIEEAARLHPDKIKIIDFNNLILRTEPTMREIAEFLGVSFNKSMLKCTVVGQEMLTKSGGKCIGKILDDPNELLNSYEKALINLDKTFLNLFKIENLKEPKAILDIALLNISRLFRKLRCWLARLILGKFQLKLDEQWKRDGFF